MAIPIQYMKSVSALEDLIHAGNIRQGRLASSQLMEQYDAMQRAGMLTPADTLEVLGMVASTLKKEQQFEMALPWFEMLCDLDIKISPESEDTAWDFYHFGECLEALGYVEKAIEAFQQAKDISCDDRLLEKTTDKLSKLWPGLV